jgi:hypothetical protein
VPACYGTDTGMENMLDRIECPVCQHNFVANYSTRIVGEDAILGNIAYINHRCPECQSVIEICYDLKLLTYREAPRWDE